MLVEDPLALPGIALGNDMESSESIWLDGLSRLPNLFSCEKFQAAQFSFLMSAIDVAIFYYGVGIRLCKFSELRVSLQPNHGNCGLFLTRRSRAEPT